MAKNGQNIKRKKTRKIYEDRSDLEKLRSQWVKLSGLHGREESSAAIVRCGTAAEIAANYAIRTEWSNRTAFDSEIVDGFLLWANGLNGKISKLFVPVYFANPKESEIAKSLNKQSAIINSARNGIVHQGRFSTIDEAEKIIKETRKFINAIVGLSIPGFDIEKVMREK